MSQFTPKFYLFDCRNLGKRKNKAVNGSDQVLFGVSR